MVSGSFCLHMPCVDHPKVLLLLSVAKTLEAQLVMDIIKSRHHHIYMTAADDWTKMAAPWLIIANKWFLQRLLFIMSMKPAPQASAADLHPQLSGLQRGTNTLKH